MGHTEDSAADKPTGRYGLRYRDMSETELEYYRDFWQEPAPAEGEPGYVLPAHRSVAARVRMANGLSFTLLLVGLVLAFIPLLAANLLLAGLGAVVALVGVGLLVAVRRRSFASLRLPGQGPRPRPKGARWFWLPHLLTVAGLATAVGAIAVIPRVFANAQPEVIRSHTALWGELTLMLWLLAALFYGLIALAVYTPEDTDDSVLRPTDFAEKQLAKDRASGSRWDDDLYDSGWISGR